LWRSYCLSTDCVYLKCLIQTQNLHSSHVCSCWLTTVYVYVCSLSASYLRQLTISYRHPNEGNVRTADILSVYIIENRLLPRKTQHIFASIYYYVLYHCRTLKQGAVVSPPTPPHPPPPGQTHKFARTFRYYWLQAFKKYDPQWHNCKTTFRQNQLNGSKLHMETYTRVALPPKQSAWTARAVWAVMYRVWPCPPVVYASLGANLYCSTHYAYHHRVELTRREYFTNHAEAQVI
jgi:hypothetical protein